MKSWNELSMAEKADVMKLAVEGGVYDLDAIRSGYNEYANGGKIHIDPSKKGTFTAAASRHGKSVQQFASQVLAHKNNYSPAMVKKATFARNAAKWKHEDGGNLYGGGGFASLITTPILPNVEELRRRLYNGVNPAGYQHIPKRIWEALNGKEANKSIYRDDQWATYLQIPEEERHHGVEKLKPARYKPSKGAPEGDVYRVTLNNEDTDNLIESVQLLGLNIGENTVDRSLDKYFGDHTIGRGYDKKGEYVSYYDKYDLNPFAGGTTIKTGVRKIDKWLKDNTSNIDMSMGIGKPFEIYDRIYLDDYYGVPKEARGATFLPEVTVIGKKKKAFGGNLYAGNNKNGQQMQLGLKVTNGWQPYTLEQILDFAAINAANKATQEAAIAKRVNDYLTTSNDATSIAIGRPQNRHLERRAVEGAKAHRAWEKEHPILNTVGLGLSTIPFVVAASPILAPAGEAFAGTTLAGISTPMWTDAALTAGFGAHGLNHAINEGIDGWGDAAMTALEVAPLGRVISPMYQAGKTLVNPIIENRGFAFKNPFGDNISWVGRGLGSHIEVSPTTDGWLGVDFIRSTKSGTGEKLYNAAIKEAQRQGLKGVKTGESLASAPKTYHTWEHYPDRVLISNTGSHGNGNMINGEVTTKVNTPEELVEATKQGIDAAVIRKAPVYGLTTPSNDVPFLSLSRAENASEQGSIIQQAFDRNSQSVGDIITRMRRDATISKYANNQRNPVEQLHERMSDPDYAAKIRSHADPIYTSAEDPVYFEGYDPNNPQTWKGILQDAYKWWSTHPDALSKYTAIRKHKPYWTDDAADVINSIYMENLKVGEPSQIGMSPHALIPNEETVFSWPIFKGPSRDGIAKQLQYNIIKSHEGAHAYITPKEVSPLDPYIDISTPVGKYLARKNNSELLPRGSQIKSYYGKDSISEEELRYAADHYVEDTGVDNNMNDMFNIIRKAEKSDPDIWRKMAKYFTEQAAVLGTGIYLTKE